MEEPEFDRPFCKSRMVVQQHMVAVVVVMASAVIGVVASVPDVSKLRHRGGFSPVDLLQKAGIDRPAVASHPAPVKIQSVCDQALVACHDVCQVAERLRCMAFGSDVDVNTAASGSIALFAPA